MLLRAELLQKKKKKKLKMFVYTYLIIKIVMWASLGRESSSGNHGTPLKAERSRRPRVVRLLLERKKRRKKLKENNLIIPQPG